MSEKEPTLPESFLNADAAADMSTAGRFPGDGEPSIPDRPLPYAGFWIRFLASLLDGLLLQGVTLLVFNPMRRAMGIVPEELSIVDLIELVVYFLYYIVLTWWSGQTLGKLITGIRVISANQPRGKLTLGQVLLREVIGKLLSAILLGLGYLWVAWNGKKQGWHDLMARTYVIRDRRNRTGSR